MDRIVTSESIQEDPIDESIIKYLSSLCNKIGLIGIVEFRFQADMWNEINDDNIIEIFPYLNASSLELFESATGLNLLTLELEIHECRRIPKYVYDEEFQTRLMNGYKKGFMWAFYRFFTPVRFAIFAELGGYDFRDSPMPGTIMRINDPISSEIVDFNQLNETQETGFKCFNSIDSVTERYRSERELLFKVLGVKKYIEKYYS
jgi:predicted ATP-grasp superfamily ATP-dependent carboligase